MNRLQYKMDVRTIDLRKLLGGYMHNKSCEKRTSSGQSVRSFILYHASPLWFENQKLGWLKEWPRYNTTFDLEVGTSVIFRTAGSSRITVVLLSQSCQTLLLGVCVDVGADNKGNNVEEGHPGLLGQELLSKGERQGRSAPADFHDGKQSSTNGGANLVESASACDDSHGGQVDGVLNWRNL